MTKSLDVRASVRWEDTKRLVEDKKLVSMIIVSYNDNKDIMNSDPFWKSI